MKNILLALATTLGLVACTAETSNQPEPQANEDEVTAANAAAGAGGTTIFVFYNHVTGKFTTTTASNNKGGFGEAYSQASTLSGCDGSTYQQTNSAALSSAASVNCDGITFDYAGKYAATPAQCFIAAIGAGNAQPDFLSTPPNRCSGSSISF